MYGRVVGITDRTVVIETSEDRVRVEFLKSAIGQVGTLDEQAAALESTQAFDPFKDESGETAAVADTSVSSAAEPPAPPELPAPPEPPAPPANEQSAADQTSDDQPAEGAKE